MMTMPVSLHGAVIAGSTLAIMAVTGIPVYCAANQRGDGIHTRGCPHRRGTRSLGRFTRKPAHARFRLHA
jgi:hypothetical protein